MKKKYLTIVGIYSLLIVSSLMLGFIVDVFGGYEGSAMQVDAVGETSSDSSRNNSGDILKYAFYKDDPQLAGNGESPIQKSDTLITGSIPEITIESDQNTLDKVVKRYDWKIGVVCSKMILGFIVDNALSPISQRDKVRYSFTRARTVRDQKEYQSLIQDLDERYPKLKPFRVKYIVPIVYEQSIVNKQIQIANHLALSLDSIKTMQGHYNETNYDVIITRVQKKSGEIIQL